MKKRTPPPETWPEYYKWAKANPKSAKKDGYIVDNKEFNFASIADTKANIYRTRHEKSNRDPDLVKYFTQ